MPLHPLLLVTDRSGDSLALTELLDARFACEVVRAEARRTVVQPFSILVADVDHSLPSNTGYIRLLQLRAQDRQPLLISVLSDDSARGRRVARDLGAHTSLPPGTPPEAIVEAIMTAIADLGCDAIKHAVTQTDLVLRDLFDVVRDGRQIRTEALTRCVDAIRKGVSQDGLEGWLAAIREYDDATYHHCLLVTGLAAALAQELSFREQDQIRLIKAAVLHDVGKARVPLEILNKPGLLTQSEQAIMRRHPIDGYTILKTSGFDSEILDVVLYHHEMLDGSGYPMGRRGRDIDDLVRLVTVCDIFAALTERRPYRRPMTSEAAFRIMRESGGALDQDLVGLLVRTVQSAEQRIR